MNTTLKRTLFIVFHLTLAVIAMDTLVEYISKPLPVVLFVLGFLGAMFVWIYLMYQLFNYFNYLKNLKK